MKNNKLLLGRPVKDEMIEFIKNYIYKHNLKSKFVVVQIGNNHDSNRYINNKLKSAEKANIEAVLMKLNENISEKELLNIIHILNNDISVNGIIVQLPLPKHIDELKVNQAILPIKDVDGFTTDNLGRMILNLNDTLLPCTPSGIIKLFDYYNVDYKEKEVVVVGRSNIVGKPMANIFINNQCTVTICNSKTKNLKLKTKNADIVIVATGKSLSFDHSYFSDNQIIVDVGIGFNEKTNSQCGDIVTEDLMNNLNNIQLVPSPNGCGQTTVGMLLLNTLNATIIQNKKSA